jgi:hypothetical protein
MEHLGFHFSNGIVCNIMTTIETAQAPSLVTLEMLVWIDQEDM